MTRHRITIKSQPILYGWPGGPTHAWAPSCTCGFGFGTSADARVAETKGNAHLVMSFSGSLPDHVVWQAKQYDLGNRDLDEVYWILRDAVTAFIPQPKPDPPPAGSEQAAKNEKRRVQHGKQPCPYCLNQFTPKNSKQKFCKPAHRVMHFQKQQRLAALPLKTAWLSRRAALQHQ